jgi:uncharacterized protein (TIGR00730 family)
MSRLHTNRQYLNSDWTVGKAQGELQDGLKLLNGIDSRIVTFFGSHLTPPHDKYYSDCKSLAFELGKRGYAILSGGGPGIMHAANSGAMEAGAHSIGIKAELLKGEEAPDSVFTETLSFKFLFARRFIMSIKSEALIFYPGGYGTLNELFEFAVLMQTGIVDTVPIICVEKAYWEGLFEWLNANPLKRDFLPNGLQDLNLLHFADKNEEILGIIEGYEGRHARD